MMVPVKQILRLWRRMTMMVPVKQVLRLWRRMTMMVPVKQILRLWRRMTMMVPVKQVLRLWRRMTKSKISVEPEGTAEDHDGEDGGGAECEPAGVGTDVS